MTRPATRVWRAGLTLAVFLAIAFTVVAPPERCPPVTAGELRRSAEATVDWFVRNQQADGTWLYLYDADDDAVASEYNEVRHAGVTMGLYQAAAAGLPEALDSADGGTEWALDQLVMRDRWAALAVQGRVTTGATALLIAGLDIRRGDTGDGRHDDVLRRLARFLVAQTEPSGAVLASYDLARGGPVPGEYSKYYTGEAYWALARLHRTFPGEGWGEVADRIGAYLATSRDEAEDHWPPIPDHWAAYGMSETVHFPDRGRPPLTADEVGYARRQAELFGIQARWLSQRYGPWGGVVRGSYEPRGGWYGVIDEALTGWWLTAREEPGLADLRGAIAERATCIAGLAVDAQSDADDAAEFARPERVEGAWVVDGETRMDDQQHALAGLLRTIAIVEAGDGAGSDAPTGWLWVAVLLLALNPARAAFAVPRAGRSPLGVAAAGGLIGGLAVCAAAALGDPLLDALDVSEPSFRIAAGLVAVLTGVTDLFRRPPAAEPALSGWRGALVPLAIPVVARPALIVLALGAGADRGVLVSAGAMAIGAVLLTALAAWHPEDRALRWAGRVLAAALVVGGVILGLDGVLAV
ncbi:MAG TPA: MarC family protein [Solirubrobacteraceae bacterium]|nr:MarC family protein [Solirubrobacteraceae bacterium]